MANSDKTILITGATSGIGRCSALHLARRGHRVLATGRRVEALAELEAEAAGTRLETLRLDVTDAASIEACQREVERRTDGYGIDVLVNNAGYGHVGPTESIAPDQLRAQYETNVFGLVAVTQAFVPAMRARGSGRIINVSSLGGRMTLPFMGVYNSTKYAVESLSDALRNELHPYGIDVVLVEPGAIHTNFGDVAMDKLAGHNRAGSPYAPFLERADLLRERVERTAVGPQAVARAIERAIVRRKPAARYVAPRAAGLALWMVQLLPTRAVDWLLRSAVGLSPRRLATARTQISAHSSQ